MLHRKPSLSSLSGRSGLENTSVDICSFCTGGTTFFVGNLHHHQHHHLKLCYTIYLSVEKRKVKPATSATASSC